MSSPILKLVEEKFYKRTVPTFHVGDTVDVLTRIVEGEKERTQIFNGVVIARRSTGINESFVVRRLVGNEGVERKFLIHSPNVIDVKIKRRGKVRRAKLYFLRHRIGKARKLRELRISKSKTAKPELAAAAV